MVEMQKKNVQWFPVYYPMGPKAFLNSDGTPGGGVAAIAELTKELPNWPILFLGLRLTNVYPLPDGLDEAGLAYYTAMKRWVDNEQTVEINLSQQDITGGPTLQVQLTGNGGFYWSPFGVPFPMAGGNNIRITVRRISPYPLLNDVPVTPEVFGTIIGAQARESEQTSPVLRRDPVL